MRFLVEIFEIDNESDNDGDLVYSSEINAADEAEAEQYISNEVNKPQYPTHPNKTPYYNITKIED